MTKLFMPALVVALATAIALTVPSIAHARVTCTQYGNTTYCTDSYTGRTTTCTTYGNTTYCS